jgi:mRNA turnover protein 4
MPKSKREKVVHLSQVQKKGKTQKERLVNKLRDACDEYARVFVLEMVNMRNTKLKEMREKWIGSRFFLGKNRVMQHALGRNASDEYSDGISKLSRRINGRCGLFFTNNTKEEVLHYFKSFRVPNYPRSGFVATEDFVIPGGVLEHYAVGMEPLLRKLGLPTRIKNAKVFLPTDTQVCSVGDKLTPNQCKLLEMFDVPMAVFTVSVNSMYDLTSESFQAFDNDSDDEDDNDDSKQMDSAPSKTNSRRKQKGKATPVRRTRRTAAKNDDIDMDGDVNDVEFGD